MKCEGFAQITDLMDYLDNNRIIAHYCGFNIMEPLPSYWTYDRCLRQLNNGALKSIMANLVRKLYELGVVDVSFVGLDSTPVMANTKQNNPKSFAKNKFSKENHPKSDPDCALGVHSASNQHNERRYEFYWGYKSHVLVDCISGLPLYELTTPGNIADSAVAAEILAAADQTVSLKECVFLADKGYDAKIIYNTVKSVYEGEAFIPLNPRGTKASEAISAGNPICEAGLAMHKDGKTTDGRGGIRQKFCCPFRQSKTGVCPCNHKNWNNGKKNRGCVKYRIVPTDYRLSMPAREDMAPQHSDDVIYRVAPYCRVSTMSEMQAESFEIQQQYYNEYIAKHPNWTLVRIYADEGISATSVNNRKPLYLSSRYRISVTAAFENSVLIFLREVI